MILEERLTWGWWDDVEAENCQLSQGVVVVKYSWVLLLIITQGHHLPLRSAYARDFAGTDK